MHPPEECQHNLLLFGGELHLCRSYPHWQLSLNQLGQFVIFEFFFEQIQLFAAVWENLVRVNVLVLDVGEAVLLVGRCLTFNVVHRLYEVTSQLNFWIRSIL